MSFYAILYKDGLNLLETRTVFFNYTNNKYVERVSKRF